MNSALRTLRHWRRVAARSYNAAPELKRLIEQRVIIAERQWTHARVPVSVRTSFLVNEVYDRDRAKKIEEEIVALRVSLDEEARG